MTALGSRGGPGDAAARVVRYLEGRAAVRAGHNAPQPEHPPTAIAEVSTTGVAGYYADSVEGPGRWMGATAKQRGLVGVVNPHDLESFLAGHDPNTQAPLISARGSSGRAIHDAPTRRLVDGDWISVSDAAEYLRVDSSYVRRLLRATEARQAELTGEKHGGVWRIARSELERFASQRDTPNTVVGYDVTFSVPKSVSLLWAASDDPAIKAAIETSIDAAVSAGLEYLENNAAFATVAGAPIPSDGFVAAAYTHATNRNLEPQLHTHVVVANVTTAQGATRALDSRSLFVHAKTAGYLAAAELRNQLTERVGVEWGRVHNGIADIHGIPRAAIKAMSTRSREIDTLTNELGLASPASRQVAALRTRAAKNDTIDRQALEHGWTVQLAALGLTPDVVAANVLDRHTPAPVTDDEMAAWSRALFSGAGVTAMSATFDRRTVIQHLATLAAERLDATTIERLTDQWLTSPDVIELPHSPLDQRCIQLANGRRVASPSLGPLHTTTHMVALESAIIERTRAGVDTGVGIAPTEIVDAAIVWHAERNGYPLGTDQQHMIHAISSSGDAIQCVLGPAGSGKTLALAVAADAWRAAGYDVVGASVNGTAAEVLGRSTGIPSRTLASLLTRLDTAHPTDQLLTTSTILIVDEASTISTRDLDRLTRHLHGTGAALRLIGDPAQHSAVAAGGMFRVLTEQLPERTPQLTQLRRQQGPEMADMRLALTEYRNGHIAQAWDRLRTNERIITATSPGELLDRLVADWYVDRQQHRLQPEMTQPSSMIAEHHVERHALNTRARLLLRQDGTITGTDVVIEEQPFAIGDDVIARAPTTLRPTGVLRGNEVRNGTRGRITAIYGTPEKPTLEVDFENRGAITVPYDDLAKEIRPGVRGIVTHAYCLTSHAAQGETFRTGRMLTTDTASRAGVYVGLSRGQHDARLYLVQTEQLSNTIGPGRLPDDLLPRLERETNELVATARRLENDGPERAAIEHLPTAPQLDSA